MTRASRLCERPPLRHVFMRSHKRSMSAAHAHSHVPRAIGKRGISRYSRHPISAGSGCENGQALMRDTTRANPQRRINIRAHRGR